MITKTKIMPSLSTVCLTLIGALLSSSAIAITQAESIANANAKKTAALEMQVQKMASMMEAMQAELTRVKAMASSSVDTAKVQELDQWMASMRHTPMQMADKDHIFLVRGGWMHMNDNRGSTEGLAGLGFDVLTDEVDKDAFYYGGAIDFTMNNDLFGFMDHTSFGIELGIEYSELGDKHDSGLDDTVVTAGLVAARTGAHAGAIAGGANDDAAATTATAAGDAYIGTVNDAIAANQQTVTVNMLRVSAAPKIRFMHGSKLRPWVIPMGIDFNIISPPSDAVTVLNTGMQFGAGVDYDVWNDIVVGLDGRYHWTPDDVDGVDTDGFTLGGSVGFRF